MKKFISNISTGEIDNLKFQISKSRILDWGSYSVDDAGISYKRLSLILDIGKINFHGKKKKIN